jgi:hypothetical protein
VHDSRAHEPVAARQIRRVGAAPHCRGWRGAPVELMRHRHAAPAGCVAWLTGALDGVGVTNWRPQPRDLSFATVRDAAAKASPQDANAPVGSRRARSSRTQHRPLPYQVGRVRLERASGHMSPEADTQMRSRKPARHWPHLQMRQQPQLRSRDTCRNNWRLICSLPRLLTLTA